MSGDHLWDEDAAPDVSDDEAHVSACLAQGGFARVETVHREGGSRCVVLVDHCNRPWRFKDPRKARPGRKGVDRGVYASTFPRPAGRRQRQVLATLTGTYETTGQIADRLCVHPQLVLQALKGLQGRQLIQQSTRKGQFGDIFVWRAMPTDAAASAVDKSDPAPPLMVASCRDRPEMEPEDALEDDTPPRDTELETLWRSAAWRSVA